jgi:hypothetical protein
LNVKANSPIRGALLTVEGLTRRANDMTVRLLRQLLMRQA